MRKERERRGREQEERKEERGEEKGARRRCEDPDARLRQVSSTLA